MLNERREGPGGGAESRAEEHLRTSGGTEERHSQVIWGMNVPSKEIGKLKTEYRIERT